MKTNKIIIPEGWEIDKVENGEIILKEIKKELPKTWEECYRLLDEKEYVGSTSDICTYNTDSPLDYNRNILPKGLGKPMLALCQLLVCREVYRNGWKPDWNDNSNKYVIRNSNNEIEEEIYISVSHILSFQSKKVCDQFFENFNDLIEEAKELI